MPEVTRKKYFPSSQLTHVMRSTRRPRSCISGDELANIVEVETGIIEFPWPVSTIDNETAEIGTLFLKPIDQDIAIAQVSEITKEYFQYTLYSNTELIRKPFIRINVDLSSDNWDSSLMYYNFCQ